MKFYLSWIYVYLFKHWSLKINHFNLFRPSCRIWNGFTEISKSNFTMKWICLNLLSKLILIRWKLFFQFAGLPVVANGSRICSRGILLNFSSIYKTYKGSAKNGEFVPLTFFALPAFESIFQILNICPLLSYMQCWPMYIFRHLKFSSLIQIILRHTS